MKEGYCSNKKCGKELPRGRSRYCSNECLQMDRRNISEPDYKLKEIKNYENKI